MRNTGTVAGVLLAGAITVLALAAERGHVTPSVEAETVAIKRLIGATWNKPDASVEIDPVVVDGDHAIAGWTQLDRGGRALLRRTNGVWRVVLCGGASLKDASALSETGVPTSTASALAGQLANAERTISGTRVRAFDSFQGIMPMGEAGAHGHH